MDKRGFLKLCISPLAGFLSPILSWAATERLKNWAGNVEYSTEKLLNVGTLNQVQDFVRKQSKFKVLGTRHCFNTIADSKEQFLSLQDMDNVVALDSAARTVTVAGRMTYGKLAPYLDSKGFALANLASLPHISIAGACSTATHGSGEKNGNLSSTVSALEIVSPGGDVITLTRQQDGERFLASVVGLGALGVVTKVTLDVQPTFQMQQYVYENLPLAQLIEHFDEIEAAAYSVSIFTDWQKQRINEVWLKKIFDPENKADAPEQFFGAKRASRNLHPIAELSAENCTEQMGVPGPWYERLPHFKMGFTPSAGKELQAEYFVPRRNAVDAILAVEKLREQIGPHLLISEIRAIAPDNLWLSPCYHQPSVTIHFTWKQEPDAVMKLLPIIERELAPYNPRPHWGKLFTIPPAQLRARYEKMGEFIRIAREFDPGGKLRNEFLNANLFRDV